MRYFRDPSDNLYELYCPAFKRAEKLPLAKSAGGDFVPPIASLGYDWKGRKSGRKPLALSALRTPRPAPVEHWFGARNISGRAAI